MTEGERPADGDGPAPASSPPEGQRGVGLPIFLALTAALVRILPLQWLHPINWDEIEFYRAANWVAQGRVPFRDFWEHHTPLAWFVFAPFTLLTDSPGVAALIAMRWVQVPVWIGAFWLLNRFMGNAGLSRFPRWSAMAVALSSSMLMTSAVEFRLDALAIVFYLAGLVLWQRGTPRAMFAAGAMFCLTGLTNMRLGPLLVITVLLLRFVADGRWKNNVRANWIFAGGMVTFAAAMLYFVLTDSIRPFFENILVHNYIGDKFGPDYGPVFLHRVLIQFGVRIMATDRLFEWAAVDAGGIAIILIGCIGLVRALLTWRRPNDLFVMAALQLAGLIVIARMIFVYNYHLQIVVLMMVPLMAWIFERIPRRGVVLAILAVAWCVNAFAAIFRGKELDLAYQDLVMHEIHARTRPDDRVFAGNAWALRREPAYSFWFLPDMVGRLVQQGYGPRYELSDIIRNPPAVLVVDQYAIRWLGTVQRDIGPFFVRHYMPVWRNVWVPAMNARVRPGTSVEWIVPRDGTYRLFAQGSIATHPWFRQPLRVSSYENNDAARFTMRLPPPAAHSDLVWWIDGAPASVNGAVALRQGQKLRVAHRGSEQLGVILLPGSDVALFRQPPPGATLEAASTRVTHVPRLGVRIER